MPVAFVAEEPDHVLLDIVQPVDFVGGKRL
jgi:hypothetical protein